MMCFVYLPAILRMLF
jgi:hypothetical protein